MSSKNSCRLCSKEYINIKESKFQIFNNSTTNIQERLSGIGVLLEEIGNTSSTICKKCFQGIKWVEKGDEIRASWINATRPKKRRLTEPDMNSEVIYKFKIREMEIFCLCQHLLWTFSL